MGIGSVLRSQYDWITQNSFRAPTSQVKKRDSKNKERKNCNSRLKYGLENCPKCGLSILKQFFA